MYEQRMGEVERPHLKLVWPEAWPDKLQFSILHFQNTRAAGRGPRMRASFYCILVDRSATCICMYVLLCTPLNPLLPIPSTKLLP